MEGSGTPGCAVERTRPRRKQQHRFRVLCVAAWIGPRLSAALLAEAGVEGRHVYLRNRACDDRADIRRIVRAMVPC